MQYIKERYSGRKLTRNYLTLVLQPILDGGRMLVCSLHGSCYFGMHSYNMLSTWNKVIIVIVIIIV